MKIIFIITFLGIVSAQSVVTFNIDGVVDCGYVSVTGTWDGWSGWGAHIDSGMQATVANGPHEFVILCVSTEGEWWNDIWGSSTTLQPELGSECDFNPADEWINYGFTVAGSDLTVSYCAGNCDATCSDPMCGDGVCNSDETAESCPDDCESGGGDQTYSLVWSDEFNEIEIDESKWNFEIGNGNWGWGNGEYQYYREENAFIEDGKLIIEALNENYGGFNYTSSRMQTRNKADFLYGKVVASIKVPEAGGTWPAFWMMPTSSVYGGWPNSGEIDIMEHYGCNLGDVHSTVHNNTYNWNGGIPPASYSTYTSATSEFHEYEMEWTEDELKFFVDGTWIGSYYNQNNGWQQWPYDQEFYIILNLAIGSHFMPCETQDGLFPQRYEIDYVRVYQVGSDCNTLGDVTYDNVLNVLDIVTIVNIVLSEELSNPCSDFNQDGTTNILDIVSLVSAILEN